MLGVLRIIVEAPESMSLKDKRSVVRSLRDRIGSRFKVSVAEVGFLDDIRQGELGVVCISNDSRHADEVMAHIAAFAVANSGDGLVDRYHTEIVHLD
ncbi:MAG TPA: DUF503 domain-containing protein [Chloroflexota bacterium]|nr:DUF503 domain-containing protein [Chloroflexota bacterium]